MLCRCLCNDYTMRGFCRTVGAWLIHFKIMKIPLAFQEGRGDGGRPGVYKAGQHWQRSPPRGADGGLPGSRRAGGGGRKSNRKRRADVDGGGGSSENDAQMLVRHASSGVLTGRSGASARNKRAAGQGRGGVKVWWGVVFSPKIQGHRHQALASSTQQCTKQSFPTGQDLSGLRAWGGVCWGGGGGGGWG